MARSSDLYDKIVLITNDYLGPASERFVSRQVLNHLGKEPSELKATDLPALIKWIRVTISVLTEDTDMVNEYIECLEQLRHKHQGIPR